MRTAFYPYFYAQVNLGISPLNPLRTLNRVELITII